MAAFLSISLFSQCSFAETAAPYTIKTAADAEFVITMDANATTGYEWRLAKPIDESMLRLVRSEYAPHRTDRVGSGGKSIWIFRAIKTGSTYIYFKYVRPWEKNIPPVEEAVYMVAINR